MNSFFTVEKKKKSLLSCSVAVPVLAVSGNPKNSKYNFQRSTLLSSLVKAISPLLGIK